VHKYFPDEQPRPAEQQRRGRTYQHRDPDIFTPLFPAKDSPRLAENASLTFPGSQCFPRSHADQVAFQFGAQREDRHDHFGTHIVICEINERGNALTRVLFVETRLQDMCYTVL
jgi:hypothetical protein